MSQMMSQRIHPNSTTNHGSPHKSPTIYILDDQKVSLSLVSGFLAGQGFEVITESESERSIEEIERILPDLILLDIFMPNLDGFAICRHLKSSEKTQHIPIIFITGSADTENRIKALESGSIDLLSKPVNFRELLLTIRLRLKLAKLRKNLATQNQQLSQEILKRKKAELELKESQKRLKTLISNSFDGITILDLEGNILFVNKQSEQIFRRKKEDLIGENLGIPIALNKIHQIEIPYSSGEIGFLEIRAVPVIWEKNNAYLVSLIDITERKKMEDDLQMLFQASEQSPVSIVITDVNGLIKYVNPKFEKVSGYSKEEVIGKNPSVLKSGHTTSEEYQNLWETISQGKEWHGEFHNRRKNGELYWEKAMISPVFNSEGLIAHYVAVKEDNTIKKQQETLLQYQARYDLLTNIPNRLHAMEAIKEMVNQAQTTQTQLALMFIDLDHFKEVNDDFGHEYGDELLIKATQRIKDILRRTDLFARLGGDEFLIAIPLVKKNQDVSKIAEKIIDCLETPFSLFEIKVAISGSIGIAFFPHDAENLEELIKNADAAMYEAKAKGRHQFQFYHPQIKTHESQNSSEQPANEIKTKYSVISQFKTENSLQRAIQNQELEIVYQPIINLQDNSLRGVEVLPRWHHPLSGLVYPQDFIPSLEKDGNISILEEWLIKSAFKQIEQLTIEDKINVHFNLSSPYLTSQHLIETLRQVMVNYDVEKKFHLVLEIKEATLLKKENRLLAVLEMLKDLSVGICLDNFGQGTSSLTNLSQFPFDCLKIDTSLVADMQKSTKILSVVKSIIAITKALKINLIAQGIETESQMQVLKKLECQCLQGYFISHPLSLENLQRFSIR